jgi:hypothetical protein
MTERERCFECLGRGVIGEWRPDVPCYCPPVGVDPAPAYWHIDPCPRCQGSGWDPESDRYRTESPVVS